MIRYLLTCVLFTFLSSNLFSQASKRSKGHPFGELLLAEKNLTTYDKDSTANAVVLYERGENYFEVINGYIRLVKKYHAKIKILDKKGFDEGTISIYYYHNDDSSEHVKDIKAITHNEGEKMNLQQSKIYTKDINERWNEKTFTFPNIKEGSILEYQYKIISPYLFNLNGWEFQGSIPKIYSEFNAKIPGNYIYNRTLKGTLPLATNDASIEKQCFYVQGYPNPADCEVLKYAMKDVPAFNEKEEFMLAPSNYISKIEFELSEHRRLDGLNKKYTKSWEAVDREFKSDKDFGRQLTKKNFFEKNVPDSLLNNAKDNLEKAQSIYKFIQNHYTWNGKYSSYGKARVKDAFNTKKGNAWEINMSLINLLNAAGIKTNMMLVSTRKNGLPKQNHPVMTDFNYILAKTTINGKDYLLDATENYLAFGALPYRALNYYGRVMDFKKDSYWQNIVPSYEGVQRVRGQVKFDIAEKRAKGAFRLINLGYNAFNVHQEKKELSEEDYLDKMEESVKGDFYITDYTFNEKNSSSEKTSELITFEVENILEGKMVYLNPFFITFFEKNPFLSKERNFPVDFGFKRSYSYSVNMLIPEGYTIHDLPKQKMIQLSDKSASLKFLANQKGNVIDLSFKLNLSQTHIPSENYIGIKELFKHVTEIQNNSLIVLKKE